MQPSNNNWKLFIRNQSHWKIYWTKSVSMCVQRDTVEPEGKYACCIHMHFQAFFQRWVQISFYPLWIVPTCKMWLPRWGSKISEAMALGLLLRWVPIAKDTHTHTRREKAQDRTEEDWWDSDTLIRAKLHSHTNTCSQTHKHSRLYSLAWQKHTWHKTRGTSEFSSEQSQLVPQVSIVNCTR